MLKTHAKFLSEIANKPLVVLDTYINATTRIRFQCKVCGRVWRTTPNHVLNSTGCPPCGMKLSAKSRRENFGAKFLPRIAGMPLIALDKYVTAKTKIRFKCLIDNHIWTATPNGILCGRGCPECKRVSIRNKLTKTNVILEDHGEWILIDIGTPAHPGATSKMNRDDFNKMRGRISMSTYGYPCVKFGKTTKNVHLMLNPAWKETDHIDRDRTNNLRSNLRECTRAENRCNASIRSDNPSGIKGVLWNKQMNKWGAQINTNGKTTNLGWFTDKEEAAKARRAGELKYHGEFAPDCLQRNDGK